MTEIIIRTKLGGKNVEQISRIDDDEPELEEMLLSISRILIGLGYEINGYLDVVSDDYNSGYVDSEPYEEEITDDDIDDGHIEV